MSEAVVDPGAGARDAHQVRPRRALRPHRALDPRRWPWWVQVLVVHALARGVTAVLLVLVARTQEATPWTPAAPTYLEYTGLMWDASWYRQVAEVGYPEGLPTGTDGRVQQNAWAFFPLFPLLARAVMTATGAPWVVVGPVLATLLGAVAMLLVHRVVADAVELYRGRWAGERVGAVAPGTVGLVTVALLTTSAAAPVLQTAYTESLALLLVAAVLGALLARRYLLAVPLVLALGLTRAVALPVAVVVLVHLVERWRSRPDDERWVALAPVVALGGLGVVAGFTWPWLVGRLTGVPDAYTRTQAAWRGTGEVVPVRPWVEVARWLLGSWGLPVLVALVVLAVVVVGSPWVRRLGPELTAWTGAYLLYLLGVLEPGTSLVRFFLLAFPLAGGLAVLVLSRRRRVVRVGLLVVLLAAGVVAQHVWLVQLWRLVPPSGWPP